MAAANSSGTRCTRRAYPAWWRPRRPGAGQTDQRSQQRMQGCPRSTSRCTGAASDSMSHRRACTARRSRARPRTMCWPWRAGGHEARERAGSSPLRRPRSTRSAPPRRPARRPPSPPGPAPAPGLEPRRSRRPGRTTPGHAGSRRAPIRDGGPADTARSSRRRSCRTPPRDRSRAPPTAPPRRRPAPRRGRLPAGRGGTAAVPAPVIADDRELVGQHVGKRVKVATITRRAHDQQHRRPGAPDLVVELGPVDGDLGIASCLDGL